MKVKELIELLQKQPPEATVVIDAFWDGLQDVKAVKPETDTAIDWDNKGQTIVVLKT